MKDLEESIKEIGDTPELRKEIEGITDLDSYAAFMEKDMAELSPEKAEDLLEVAGRSSLINKGESSATGLSSRIYT